MQIKFEISCKIDPINFDGYCYLSAKYRKYQVCQIFARFQKCSDVLIETISFACQSKTTTNVCFCLKNEVRDQGSSNNVLLLYLRCNCDVITILQDTSPQHCYDFNMPPWPLPVRITRTNTHTFEIQITKTNTRLNYKFECTDYKDKYTFELQIWMNIHSRNQTNRFYIIGHFKSWYKEKKVTEALQDCENSIDRSFLEKVRKIWLEHEDSGFKILRQSSQIGFLRSSRNAKPDAEPRSNLIFIFMNKEWQQGKATTTTNSWNEHYEVTFRKKLWIRKTLKNARKSHYEVNQLL